MNTGHKSEWLVVVNPNAGKGLGEKDWNIISGLLGKYGISVSPLFTASKNHAVQLTRESISKGFRDIIVVGGDGTLNEVVNGIFLQHDCPTADITLAMIPVGSGNDWSKLYSIPLDYEGAIRIIRDHRTRLHDAGLVEFHNGSAQVNRYFLNIAGLAFDAAVVERTNRQKEKGRKGKALYLVNLLHCLLFYKPVHTNIEIDGTLIRQDVFTISIGIGRFSGGGRKQTPGAIPDDGMFDMTIVNKIGKIDIILSLKMLYDGTILKHPKIQGFTGKRIRVDSAPPTFLEVDGESLGHTPVTFSSIPASLKIVYGDLHNLS